MSRAQAAKVTIDYEKSVEEVYTEFTASLIENTGSLLALSEFPFTSARAKSLPTWVPDLRNSGSFTGLTYFSASSHLGQLSKPKIVSDSHLVVHGLLLDWIDGLGAYRTGFGLNESPNLVKIVQAITSEQLQHAYTDFEGLRIAFWSTLLCVAEQHMDRPVPLTREQFVAICETSGLARSVETIFEANDNFLIFGYSLDSISPLNLKNLLRSYKKVKFRP